MIVHDFNFFRTAIRPIEAYAPLVVDPNGVLSSPIARKRFEPISRNGLELAPRALKRIYGKALGAFPARKQLRSLCS